MKPLFESYRDFIPDYDDFLESLGRPLPVHLRINRLKIEPSDLLCSLAAKQIAVKKSISSDDTLYWAPGLNTPGHLLEYTLGYLHSQSLTSCLASLALAPGPETSVLDLCAAPGGKTAHLAQIMRNSGLIVANELFFDRHALLNATLARLGVLNAVLTTYGAQEFPLHVSFDFVLADVPCSGEGRFRDLGRETHFNGYKYKTKLIDLQKRTVLRGFDLLKPNGVMVYATCTYNPEENEAVLDFLLKNRPAEILALPFEGITAPGLSQWRKEHYDPQLQRAARFYPHRTDSVGFFMARIGKRG